MTQAGRAGLVFDLALLVALAVLLFLPYSGDRDLWNPNEPIYGRAVVEMAERGDWIVPTVNGEPFVEKPILVYWAALAASAALGGVDERSLRVPSAAAGVASVVLLYLLVLPYAGRRQARLAAALLATTFLVFWSARRIQMDLPLMLFTLAVIVAVTAVWDRELSPGRGWILVGVAAAGAFLSKGPVGWLLPALVLAVYRLTGVRDRRLAPGAVAVGAGVALALTVPWYVLLATRDGGLLHEVLVRQNFTRYLEPWDHQEPWWYFLKYLWIDLLPWAWLLPLAIGLPAKGDGERRLRRLAWLWLILVVAFFSVSGSKRSPYILPAAPAVAILASSLLEHWLAGRVGIWRAGALRVLCGALATLLLGAAGWVAWNGWPGPAADVLPRGPSLAVLALAGGLLALAALVSRRRAVVLPSALVLAFGALFVFAASRLPEVDRYKSARSFCRIVDERVGERPLRSYRPWKWRASYAFYLDRTIPKLEDPDALARYWHEDGPVFLLVERDRLEEVRGLLGGAEPIESGKVGGNAAYLFTNRGAGSSTVPAAPGRRSTAGAG